MFFDFMDSFVLLIVVLLPFVIILFYLHVLSIKLDKLIKAVDSLEERYDERGRA